MTTEEQMKFSQRYARFNTQPQSLLGKVLTLVLGAAFLVLAFMFSLVALAVVAVGGTLLWGWLWWKTRAIRKQMREQGPGFPPQPTEGNIIDGEVIRDTDAPPQSGRLLRCPAREPVANRRSCAEFPSFQINRGKTMVF